METVLEIVAQFLNLSNERTSQAVGAGLQFGLGKWQEHNLRKFKTHVEFQLKTLNQKKVDRSYLHSEQFTELLLGFVEGASKTASQVKHKAFANALRNSVYGTSSGFSDRPVLQRILLQMSEGEIEALLALFEKTRNVNNNGGDVIYEEKGISTLLDWSQEDTFAALLSLSQLGLATGGIYAGAKDEVIWNVSTLAQRLAIWCSEDANPIQSFDVA